LILTDLKYITEEVHKSDLRRSQLQPGDVLVTITGRLGTAAVVPPEIERANINQHICLIRLKKNVANPYYIAFHLNSDESHREIMSKQHGSTRIALNHRTVNSLRINLPPMEIQTKIAATLKQANLLKQTHEQANQLANKIIQSVFAKMFGDPEGNEKGWPVKSLGEMMKISDRMVKPDREHQSMIHVGGENIQGRTGNLINLRSIEQDGIRSMNFVFSPHEILYCKIRPNLQKVALPDFSGLCSADIYPLMPADGVSREFLWQLLKSEAFTRYATSISASRANIPKINRKEMENYVAICPPSSIQETFCKFVGRCGNVEKLQESSLRMLNELFHSLMHKAFGELAET
jgi:type I restriction enzyme S subunit